MTDRHPSDPTSAIEDRLRATLAAEADRHPVRPDLERLRSRADRTVVDLRLPPRRNRARILAAAVVIAVLAAGAAAVVRSGGDDETDQVAARGAPATGWYLPGDGWEIVGVEVLTSIDLGTTRQAVFAPTGASTSSAYLQVGVYPVATLDGVTDAWEADGAVPVTRGADDHPAWMVDEAAWRGEAPIAGRRVLVPGEDEVLVLDGSEVARDILLAVADRWRDTDGREIALPDGSDLSRTYDTTDPEPRPVDAGALAADQAPGPARRSPLVAIDVEHRAGAQASYSLTGPGGLGRVTGVGDDDGGAGAGIEPGARRRPVEGTRDDGEVWEVPNLGAPAHLVGLLPGADVAVGAPSSDDPSASTASAADLVDLMAALRPVDGSTWAASVASASDRGRDWPATLAELEADDGSGPGTLLTEDGEPIGEATPPASATTEPSNDDPTAADPDLSADALLELIEPTSDPDWVRDSFTDELTVGFVGSTDADVVLTGEDRFAPERWVLDTGGRWGREGPTSALEQIAGVTITPTRPGSPTPRCAATSDPGRDDLVTLTPVAFASCIDWFAVVVGFDDGGRIAEVRLALWEP